MMIVSNKYTTCKKLYIGWNNVAKIQLFTILIFISVLFIYSTPVMADESVQNEIRNRLLKWTEDFNNGNVSEVCSLFASSLIASYQGQPDKTYDDMCRLLSSSLTKSDMKFHYSLKIEEIIVSGDLAIARVLWTLETMKNGEVKENIDKGLDVFQRQKDGEWRITRFIAYPLEGRD